MKYDFTKEVRRKGYTLKKIQEIWELKKRKMARIAKNPKKYHWEALKNLPDIKKGQKP